jgi:hypothetical protein
MARGAAIIDKHMTPEQTAHIKAYCQSLRGQLRILETASENFFPPASDLRHNPAAQGRLKVQLNDWAQPNPQTGRIQ